MQSSHRLHPAMALVRALLAPTASGHVFMGGTHGQTWTGWERSGEKGLIISDNQAFSCLIIKTFDNQTVSSP
jgi:hypothetical protein